MLSNGTRIGSYEIVSPLGAGGMGEVFRARDLKLGREVAIKVLPEAFASDPERLVRFQREAHRVARGRIPADEALPIARQIAEAWEAAHGQGIIPRDLKPANLKLTPDGKVKVLDFGLSRRQMDHLSVHQVVRSFRGVRGAITDSNTTSPMMADVS